MLPTRTSRCSTPEAWGVHIVWHTGMRRPKVLVARRLAIVLHRMECCGPGFRWDQVMVTAWCRARCSVAETRQDKAATAPASMPPRAGSLDRPVPPARAQPGWHHAYDELEARNP